MIETYIPTGGAGDHIFLGSINLLKNPIYERDLNSIMILLSDKLILDDSWKAPYVEFESRESVTENVIQKLKDNGIVKEIYADRSLHRQQYTELFSQGLSEFIRQYTEYIKVYVSDDFYDIIWNKPFEALDSLLSREKDVPPVKTGDLGFFLDSMFTSIYVGSYCCRIFDPRGYLNVARKFLEKKGKNQIEDLFDWVFGICSVSMPKIPIFISMNGNPARADYPMEALGAVIEGSKKEKPDLSKTMANLDKLLYIRNLSVVKDLREMYIDLKEQIESGKFDEKILPVRESFHKQWSLVRAELKNSLSISRQLEFWTDVITIPSAIISFYAPITGAIPVITWSGAKLSGKIAKKKIYNKYPWFSFAEQMGDLALKVKETFIDKEG